MALFDFLTGRGPKKHEYQIDPGTRARGQDARAAAEHWKNTLEPILTQYRDMTFDHDPSGTLTGRAGADVNQAAVGLGTPTFRGDGVSGSSLSNLGRRASAAIEGQMQAETEAVHGQKLQDQFNVLEGVLGQDVAATRALSDVSRMQQQERNAKLRGDQYVRQAKGRFFTDLGAMVLAQGGRNIGSGGTFWQGQGLGLKYDPQQQQWGSYGDTGFWGLGRKDWRPYRGSPPGPSHQYPYRNTSIPTSQY